MTGLIFAGRRSVVVRVNLGVNAIPNTSCFLSSRDTWSRLNEHSDVTQRPTDAAYAADADEAGQLSHNRPFLSFFNAITLSLLPCILR